MKNKSWFMAVLVLVVMLMVVTACAAPAAKPAAQAKILKLGSIVPLSGPAAQWGKEGEPLGALYAQIVKDEGGVKVGDDVYQIEFITLDGPMFPTSADLAACRSMVYDKKVDAIAVYFGVAVAPMASITNAAKVVFNQATMFAGYYDPKKHPYCFFGYPTLEIAATQPLAAAQAFNAKAMAYTGIKSGNQDLESTFASTDRQFEQQYGIKVFRHFWAADAVDFTPYLQQMKQEGVEMIYTMENINTVCLLKKQAYQMGWNVPVVMSGAVLDLDVIKGICGSAEAMEGICGDYSGAVWELKKTKISPYYLEFANKLKAAWKAKTGKELTNTGIISTGCQMICQYIEAVKIAGTKDPDAVMKAIKGGTMDTILGTYTFSGHTGYDADVVCGYPTGISIIKNGKITYLTEYPIPNIDTDVPIKRP